jgi:tRNA nucleotidyltransferase (CCA-adding enzyme)
MAESFVTHKDIYGYAEEKVNIRREDLTDRRAQVNRLRENLEPFIAAHPHYNLIKMLLAGSVIKGTALKDLNDMDLAVYIRKAANNPSESQLINWLVERLREAYKDKGVKPEQIQPSAHCATIVFVGTGLQVDVSPVIYDGGADDRGYLVNKDSGQRVLTSIPLHLAFIRKRKDRTPHHYRQVIRLVKWWIKEQKRQDEDHFRFKSFMAELICAHLSDTGVDFTDYIKAMEAFFVFIIKTGLRQRISFTDNYGPSMLPAATGSPIEIFDPVNPNNNVASSYTVADRDRIVEAAKDALDAMSEAQYATTKGRAVDCWKRIFGPTFNL